MTEPTATSARPNRLDARALDRAWTRLASAPPPWLHAEAARRMSERLRIVRQVPAQVLDWWGECGASAGPIEAVYPKARIVRVARPGGNDGVAQAPVPAWRRFGATLGWSRAPRVVCESDVADGQAQLVWSNMALHWAPDVPASMRQWQRSLAVEGFLMFTTLGAGTLTGLQSAYAARGWGPAHAPWIDMHDLGDMLVEAGFADPVMDQETLRLSYSSPAAALAELRQLGANTDRLRHAGLRTPRWRERLFDALRAQHDAEGRCVLEFELVHGHAFKPPPQIRLAARTELDLADMKSMLRRGRPPRADE